MRLARVELRDFRNHRETKLEVPAGAVAVVGANAQGKTNLLEGVHYLATLTSPRAGSDLPLVRQGCGSAFLRGEMETGSGRVLVEVEVRASGANRIQVGGAGVRRKRDVRRRVRSVLFIPEDLAIVQGGPEERRRFLDQAAEALWPASEAPRRAYERALRQRNRLLKEHEGPGAPQALEAWDAELALHGAAVTSARRDAVERLAPRASEDYRAVAGDPLVIDYQPSVSGDDLEAAFGQRLAQRQADELVRRTTLVGPHRDELALAVGGLAARGFASHGESWGAALCLRLGLAAAVAAEIGDPPLLLLDDPFSGLDPVRRRLLWERLEARGQILLSVPDESQVPPGVTVWEVRDGQVSVR